MGDRQFLRYTKDNGKRDIDVDAVSPLPVQMCSPYAQSFVSTFGDQQVAQRIQDVQVQFPYNISTVETVQALTGTGSITHGNQMAQIHSGTGVGSARLSSIDSVRYRPGFSTFGLFTTIFTAPEANTKQLAGLFDADHGFAIGYNETTFGITMRNSGTDDFTAATWIDNLDGNGPSGYKIDLTKMNIFQISFGWLGAAPIMFYVHGGHTKGWIPFAVIDKINVLTAPTIENPALALSVESSRTSGTGADLIIKTASWGAGSIQSAQHEYIGGRYFSTRSAKTAVTAGTLTNILTLKSVTVFQSVESHVLSELASVSLVTEGTKQVQFELWEDATLAGTPTYADINSTNSIMQVDVAGTDVSGGTFIDAFEMQKVDSDRFDIRGFGVYLRPGHTLTLAAESVNSFDASASVRWLEKF